MPLIIFSYLQQCNIALKDTPRVPLRQQWECSLHQYCFLYVLRSATVSPLQKEVGMKSQFVIICLRMLEATSNNCWTTERLTVWAGRLNCAYSYWQKVTIGTFCGAGPKYDIFCSGCIKTPERFSIFILCFFLNLFTFVLLKTTSMWAEQIFSSSWSSSQNQVKEERDHRDLQQSSSCWEIR